MPTSFEERPAKRDSRTAFAQGVRLKPWANRKSQAQDKSAYMCRSLRKNGKKGNSKVFQGKVIGDYRALHLRSILPSAGFEVRLSGDETELPDTDQMYSVPALRAALKY